MTKRISVFLCVVVILFGCRTTKSIVPGENRMKTLTISWQRLVDEKGETCERCGATEKEVQKAFLNLKESLTPLGIKVALEKKALDPATCAKDVSQSNRIWIGNKSLEQWLDAEVGKSLCGFCCEELGDGVECRTVTVDGQTYETIPAQLIIKAGLIAASQLVGVSSTKASCPEPTSTEEGTSSCCPKPTRSPKECK